MHSVRLRQVPGLTATTTWSYEAGEHVANGVIAKECVHSHHTHKHVNTRHTHTVCGFLRARCADAWVMQMYMYSAT